MILWVLCASQTGYRYRPSLFLWVYLTFYPCLRHSRKESCKNSYGNRSVQCTRIQAESLTEL